LLNGSKFYNYTHDFFLSICINFLKFFFLLEQPTPFEVFSIQKWERQRHVELVHDIASDKTMKRHTEKEIFMQTIFTIFF